MIHIGWKDTSGRTRTWIVEYASCKFELTTKRQAVQLLALLKGSA